jgi:hypothetical protein
VKILRVFPRRTSHTPDDEMAAIGGPGLFRPAADEVHISVVFDWDIPGALRLAAEWQQFYPNVRIGGPACGDPGGEFVAGRYVRKGITITSRGCPMTCPWCVVPKREGGARCLPIVPGHIVQDNNLLATPREHQERVFEMLAGQKGVVFSGGLDVRLLGQWHIEQLEKISVREIWVAQDQAVAGYCFCRAAEMLSAWSRQKKRCYVLVGWDKERPADASRRLEDVWQLGFLPFAQFYRGPGEQPMTAEWRKLVREWSRPAATKAHMRGKN